MAKALSLALALILGGCTAQAMTQEEKDWQLICSFAPHRAGQPIGILEQRAMTRLDVWSLSVEELDEQCLSR